MAYIRFCADPFAWTPWRCFRGADGACLLLEPTPQRRSVELVRAKLAGCSACVHGAPSILSHNYIGRNCIYNQYIGHNCIGNDYIGRNCIGHDYIGHNYIGEPSILSMRM